MSNTEESPGTLSHPKGGVMLLDSMDHDVSNGGRDLPLVALFDADDPVDGLSGVFLADDSVDVEVSNITLVGIPTLANIFTNKTIEFCKCEEHKTNDDNTGKWEVEWDGETGPFMDTVRDEIDFDNNDQGHWVQPCGTNERDTPQGHQQMSGSKLILILHVSVQENCT